MNIHSTLIFLLRYIYFIRGIKQDNLMHAFISCAQVTQTKKKKNVFIWTITKM